MGWQVGAGMTMGGQPQLLSTGCLRVLTTWQLASPRDSEPRDQAGSGDVFYEPGLRSHTLSLPQYLFWVP